ncbi:MAG: type I-E CRISPR-associated protein Cas5/CasD [Acidobacteria bacterium]|nr:type I-E CRISPR-associated protein Cas5/CasD [Acidobacteriota bacterium]
MARFLLFQLAGPLASWGEIAIGEDRHSALHPSRSAVLGILASALGIRRAEEDRQRELAAGYRVAVVTCDPGELLRDYHTTQVPSSTETKGWQLRTRRDELAVIRWSRQTKGKGGEAILSSRDYRCDGRWVVGIQEATGDAPFPLDALREALLAPRLCLFLGRKSCPPSLPLEPRVVEAPDLLRALEGLRFESLKLSRRPNPKRRSGDRSRRSLHWEAGMDVGIPPQDSAERWDDPVSRARWQFRPRLEHHAPLPPEVTPCS